MAEAGESYPSWDSVLANIGNALYSHVGGSESRPLEFDALLCDGLRLITKEKSDDLLKQSLTRLDEVPVAKDSLYVDLIATGVKSFMTTNYDYAFERAVECWGAQQSKTYQRKPIDNQETRVSNRRRTVLGEIALYHIHGELDYIKSICLGHIHYAENLQRIIETITLPANDDASLRLVSFNSNEKAFQSWAARFFTDDVYIIGSSLNESEIDIWWVLAFRSFLISTHDEAAPTNKIRYLCAFKEREPEICSLLRMMQVEVIFQKVMQDDWKTAYRNLIKRIGE